MMPNKCKKITVLLPFTFTIALYIILIYNEIRSQKFYYIEVLKMKKSVSLLIAVSLCLSVILCFPFSASAIQPTSGKLGENITWTLTGDVLTISGTGAMTEQMPWIEDLNDSITKIVIKDGVTELPDDAFPKYFKLVTVELADSVTKLGDSVFGKCYDLQNIKMSKNLQYIGKGTFMLCSLSEITIPESVTHIGDRAFIGCSLKSLHIPDSVIFIGDGMVSECRSITSLTVGKNNEKYYSVNNCIIERDTKTLIAGCNTSVIPSDGSVTKIANESFGLGNNCKNITIPEGITEIGDWAFQYCEGLESIKLPNSITSIGEGAFYGCDAVTEISIPNKPISVGAKAFGGTEWYHTRPAGVVYLGNHAIACNDQVPVDIVIKDGTLTIADGIWRSSLENITIPKSVIHIEEDAFTSCAGGKSFPAENLTVHCYSGSYAETYCKRKGLNYTLLDVTVSDSATDNNENKDKHEPKKNYNTLLFVSVTAIVVIAIATTTIILIKKRRAAK